MATVVVVVVVVSVAGNKGIEKKRECECSETKSARLQEKTSQGQRASDIE
jgi:hypothetical protein